MDEEYYEEEGGELIEDGEQQSQHGQKRDHPSRAPRGGVHRGMGVRHRGRG